MEALIGILNLVDPSSAALIARGLANARGQGCMPKASSTALIAKAPKFSRRGSAGTVAAAAATTLSGGTAIRRPARTSIGGIGLLSKSAGFGMASGVAAGKSGHSLSANVYSGRGGLPSSIPSSLMDSATNLTKLLVSLQERSNHELAASLHRCCFRCCLIFKENYG